jgi:hypothetical protein
MNLDSSLFAFAYTPSGTVPDGAYGDTLNLDASILDFAYTIPAQTFTNFTTDYFNTNEGWERNIALQGQKSTDPVGERWQTNDPFDDVEFGETDLVAYLTGYTPGTSAAGNSSLIQGGLTATSFGYLPGTDNVRLWRDFTPTTGPLISNQEVKFFTEWSLINSLDSNLPDRDIFAFDLRTAGDADSIIRLQLTPDQSTTYTLQAITNNGGSVSTLTALGYQFVFQMELKLYGGNYDLVLYQINPSTRAIVSTSNLVTAGNLSSGATATDFATVALDWELNSGDNTQPGSNYIIVNDFTVSTTADVAN